MVRKRGCAQPMSYTDFTLESLQQTFGLSVEARPLFVEATPVKPTAWLVESLRRGQGFAPASEKARSEFIVAPVLLTCRELLNDTFVIYSGVRLDVDADRGLKGECDFILARSPTVLVLQAPLLIVLEAKKNDIEEGLGQCAAQMVAARLFNERHQTSVEPLFGCVTTGETWQFLRLENGRLYLDTQRYFINEIDKILGILTTIMKAPPGQQTSDAA
jgi:hypothetical protein